MADFLIEFLLEVFHSKEIATLFISMFPLIELKGAIPIGTGMGMSLFQTAFIAYIGSTLVSVVLFLLLKPVFLVLKKVKLLRTIIEKIECIFNDKAEKIANKQNGKYLKTAMAVKLFSVFVFVAVPFPITGVWTGTGIAIFLNIKIKEGLPAIALGNLIAGSIITILTALFSEYVDTIIYCLFVVAIVMLVIFIIKLVKAKPNKTAE